MSAKQPISLEELLNNPDVKTVTGATNHELIERRRSKPPRCDVFAAPYTQLKEDSRYRFDIDREAREQLPDIINNTVQSIVGVDSPDAAFQEHYRRERRIGIVFSGGPAPGGHNVIAGLWDAARRANPDTKVYGFILGPDGIIENEAIELTDELVDAYRNLAVSV